MVATAKPTDRQYVAAAIVLSSQAFLKGNVTASICMSGVAQGIAVAKGVDYADVMARMVKEGGSIPTEVTDVVSANMEILANQLEEAAAKIYL